MTDDADGTAVGSSRERARAMNPPRLEDPVSIGGLELRNRLYRAPLLECAGNGPDAVDALIAALEPGAEAGVGLIHQGATIVTAEGGCAAPGMTRVHDADFVADLQRLTDVVHSHGAAIAIQLEHGGLRSMETWHAAYRDANPGLEQLAVSRPPWPLRLLDRLGLLSLDPRVLSTSEAETLAADFGRAAARAVDAGYDAIHIAGANMGLVQQFLSPFYNRRTDRFGVDPDVGAGTAFLELIAAEVRDRAGDVPLMTKVPSEEAAPFPFRPRLSDDAAVRACERLTDAGFDAVVPVRTSVFWDMSIVRGEFPSRAWRDRRFRPGFLEAFGSRSRAAVVAAGNWLQSLRYNAEPGWNADLCRRVRERVDVPVLCEGGLRARRHLDGVLASDADLAGMARPFYAEPRLPARLLGEGVEGDRRVVCESCNNCAVAQVAGDSGVCRTPPVLKRAGELRKRGAYDRVPGSDRE